MYKREHTRNKKILVILVQRKWLEKEKRQVTNLKNRRAEHQHIARNEEDNKKQKERIGGKVADGVKHDWRV